MRHNYVGDEGDYAKLALLEVLSAGRTLGVNWYLTDHEEGEGQQGAGDGNKLAHLTDDDWLYLDDLLLMRMRKSLDDWLRGNRHIGQLEALLPGAVFHREPLPTGAVPMALRAAVRDDWHLEALDALEAADIVFVDPDNGFEIASVGRKAKRRCKYATYAEISDYLDRGQAVVAYQHKPRLSWAKVVEKVCADLRAHGVPTADPGFIAFGSRGFFLMHPDPPVVEGMTQRAKVLEARSSDAPVPKLTVTVMRTA